MFKKIIAFLIIQFSCCFAQAGGKVPPLLPETTLIVMAEEISGIKAKRSLEFLAQHHRMRGSHDYLAAAEYIADQLRQYGLSEVAIEQIPADGITFYGPQKARLAWDAEFAELWEVQKSENGWKDYQRLASWKAMPITLAQDSESADVIAELVDIGTGTDESDYAGKDVRGRVVLAAAQPGPVSKIAVEKYGAAGIVSYAQNQRTAWWGENENLVRWGHLESFSAPPTFAFMVSLKQARSFQKRISEGESIWLRAKVRAGQHVGFYNVVMAVIPGSDPTLKNEEIAFSCHLDHQLPGANDNASGSVTILEIARTFAKLIREEKIARPDRTLRFIWPPEIEGTHALLNTRTELVERIKAVIHMDMVGGSPETKAIFHITRGPASLPSFIYDVAETFGEFVNRQSDAFASGFAVDFPLISPEGGKEALQAVFADFSTGSDHVIYTDGSYGIPAIYLNDWPDRYIHTNFDTPANIDPTKLKRAAFIGAACGYFVANVNPENVSALWSIFQRQCLRRTATMLERREELTPDEAANLTEFHFRYEREVFNSIARFAPIPDSLRNQGEIFWTNLETLIGKPLRSPRPQGEGEIVYRRNPALKGPLDTFGYDYLKDHFGEEKTQSLGLLQYRGLRASGHDYAYEVLNFVDGQRSVQEIRDAVSAAYGPLPLSLVLEYLQALESIGVVTASSGGTYSR